MNKIIEQSSQRPIHANTVVKQAKLPQMHHQMNKFVNNGIFKKNSMSPLELDFMLVPMKSTKSLLVCNREIPQTPKGLPFPEYFLTIFDI